jgi:hypothetical protein
VNRIWVFLGSTLLILLSILGTVLTEYWKLVETDSRYLISAAAAALFFMLGLVLLPPFSRLGHKLSFIRAFQVTLGLSVLYVGMASAISSTELNKVLNAKSRCESVVSVLARDAMNDFFSIAQDSCRLRMLQATLSGMPIEDAEKRVMHVARLLHAQNRLNDTTLVTLLGMDSHLEKKREPSLHSSLDELETELALIDLYTVQDLFSTKTTAQNIENLRMQKLIELSTLGKTLGILIAHYQSALADYRKILANPDNHVLDSGEISLVESRTQSLRTGFNRVIKRWDLLAKLNSLHLDETYPDLYLKVKEQVNLGEI